MMKIWQLSLLTLAFSVCPVFAQSPLPSRDNLAVASIFAGDAAQKDAVPEAALGDCPTDGCRRWSFRVIPYGWIMEMDGDVTVRGVTAPVDVSMGKMLDIFFNELNFAAIGQIEATNGTFGFLVNGIYADVSPGRQVRRLDFSSHFRVAILDSALTYNLEGVPERLGLPDGSQLEALAGVRYISLSAGLTVTGPRGNSATAEGTEDWVDPIIGGRLRVPLRQCLTAQVRGDIGGFGIGEASDFTWNIEAILEYRCSPRCSLFAGYRWLDIDYSNGSGSRRFGFDMNLSGPLIGVALDF